MWVIWYSGWEYKSIAIYVTAVITIYYLAGIAISVLHKKMTTELDKISDLLREIKGEPLN
jgi:hypothetical protein